MTSKIEIVVKQARGRPRGFDREAAVQAAMHLFWERGYEGASFEELTLAMGINASSFRNTFKTKEALYREATDLYVADAGTWLADVLAEEKEVRAAFQRLFSEAAVRATRKDHPSGCMVSLAATHVPPSLGSLKDMMSAHRGSAEKAMADRLKRGQKERQISPDVDIKVLAAFMNTMIRGIAVQARDGATRGRLLEIGKVAMRAFPVSAAPSAEQQAARR